MSALVPMETFANLPTTVGEEAAYQNYAKSGGFLLGLRFSSKGKDFENGKHVPPGHYYVQDGDDLNDLGPTVDVIPLCRRRKAFDWSSSPAIVAYDPNSAEFKRIEAESQGKDAQCSEGPSFLVIERTTGKFLELFCATKGLKQASLPLGGYLAVTVADCQRKGLDPSEARGPLGATLGNVFAKTPYGTHRNPTVSDCSTPFNVLPTQDAIVAEMKKFLEAKATDLEAVPATEAPKRAR